MIEVQGGIGKLARRSSLNREGLYNMLSEQGNSRLTSLSRVLEAAGLQIAVTKKFRSEITRSHGPVRHQQKG